MLPPQISLKLVYRYCLSSTIFYGSCQKWIWVNYFCLCPFTLAYINPKNDWNNGNSDRSRIDAWALNWCRIEQHVYKPWTWLSNGFLYFIRYLLNHDLPWNKIVAERGSSPRKTIGFKYRKCDEKTQRSCFILLVDKF